MAAASAWDDMGNASSLLQVLGVDVFGLASMITQAALTARRNRDACLQLAEHVRVVAGLLRRLRQTLPRLRRHPETRRPLERLDDAMRRAYLLVRSCGQQQAYLYQLLTGAHTAAKLRAAEEEIDRYIRLVPLISLVATVRVEGTDEVMELDSDAPTSSPRLSFEEAHGSAAISGLVQADDVLLPGIEGFQIVGEPELGSMLRTCGFPTNGTTTCCFQWVRYLDDGTRQSIDGAIIYDYLVTADDVDTILGVECIPRDDNGLKGELVSAFSNGKRKIACDSVMQSEIDLCVSNREALFNVLIMVNSSYNWRPATLVLSEAGYEIKREHIDDVAIKENYSKIKIEIPCGLSTPLFLVSSGGVTVSCSTSGKSGSNNKDGDVRLRDFIVLVIRAFQKKVHHDSETLSQF